MENQLAQVLEFYKAFRIPHNTEPKAPDNDRQFLRWRLISEEFNEVSKEMKADPEQVDLTKMAKELADLLYVVHGTVIEFGLQDVFGEVFSAVHASNMSKLRSDGTPIIDHGGKILKSENYFEPDLSFVTQKIAA